MYLVLGLGKSGFATAAFLKKQGISFVIFDDSEQGKNKAKSLGYSLFLHEFWPQITRVITGPGIPYYYPSPHPLIKEAKERNLPIITDCTLLQEYTPRAKYIGVTGTNGKSTTTALLTHTLKQAGVNAVMGGNIGVPALDLPLDADVYVLELSSFQLERSPPFNLDVAVWTNLAEDHLTQHGTMEDYIACKRRIFEKAHHKIISVDDAECARVTKEYSDAIPVTIQNAPKELQEHPYLKGEHNLQNRLMAYEALRALGLNHDLIIKGISSFKGLSHRQEFVTKHKHITFINDSKATSAAATEHALKAYENIYWLLGGQDKTDGIDPLAPLFSKITKAYTYGAAKNRFYDTLQHHGISCAAFDTLEQALHAAYTNALHDANLATILLSPACASYDQFKDFEARGDYFMEKVRLLLSL